MTAIECTPLGAVSWPSDRNRTAAVGAAATTAALLKRGGAECFYKDEAVVLWLMPLPLPTMRLGLPLSTSWARSGRGGSWARGRLHPLPRHHRERAEGL